MAKIHAAIKTSETWGQFPGSQCHAMNVSWREVQGGLSFRSERGDEGQGAF